VLKDYKRKLFKSYNSTHVAYLDTDDQSKLNWFVKYLKRNYLSYIDRYDKSSSKLLEIGCNKGYMLAALKSFGFQNLHGVDLSPDDVEKAKILVPSAEIVCTDAFDYLKNKLEQFDIIILKAVLEHIQKDEIMPFLEKIKDSLNSGGSVIIDVPNMDWLFASHERYMDFTHEIGFTKESLRQIMSSLFSSVHVIAVDNILESSLFTTAKKRIARFICKKILSWADPEGGINPIWARSIIGIGKK
jgi:2-polyprenyl-3-methyl-5-hydroxy-6-metoxy-1,4-benzoquinol methylase